MIMYDFLAKIRNICSAFNTSNMHIWKIINVTTEMLQAIEGNLLYWIPTVMEGEFDALLKALRHRAFD